MWLENSYTSVFRLKMLMYELLVLLARESLQIDGRYHYRKIKKAVDFMENNYLERIIDVKELADMSELSISQFNRIFKQVYKATPIKYMNAQRIEIAKKLLVGTNEQIGIIAEMCGFANTHYFSKMFKQITGMSPLRFRTLMS